MKTDKFEPIQTPESITKCLEYSEKPDELKALLSQLSISVRFDGIKKHFADDKQERLTGTFLIERNKRKIEFEFGFSINDTETFTIKNYNTWFDFKDYHGKRYNSNDRGKLVLLIEKDKKEFMEGLLYSCLASCGMDFHCPKSFSEFCSDFGYDEDSRKAETTWKACLEQSAKLEKIFSADEIEYLPR